MRSLALLASVVVAIAARPARAAGPAYDDREIIRRAIVATGTVRRLRPKCNQTSQGSRPFAGGQLTVGLGELRAVLRTISGALRERGASEEILTHRQKIAALTRPFLAAFNGYRMVFTASAAARKQLAAIKRAKPPGG